MPKRPTPPAAAPLDENASAERVADELARAYDAEPVTIEDLLGTPMFLEVLDGLPPQLRAKHGFTFSVYDASRGPLAYMPDSDWGDTVPTEAALAQRYGPGVYRVRPKRRRKGPGGGNAPEITVRIASARDPNAPAGSGGLGSDRVWDLLEHVVVGAREDSAAARSQLAASGGDGAGGAWPAEPPEWVARLVQAIQSNNAPPDDMPPWMQQIVGSLIQKFVGGAAAPAAGAGATPPAGA